MSEKRTDLRAERQQAIVDRLHTAWHELYGAYLLADNNGFIYEGAEIQELCRAVGRLKGKLEATSGKPA